MKTRPGILLLMIPLMLACNFSRSARVDLLTGLKTRGKGLSCEEVYLSDGESKINRNSFTYGETIFLNFDEMTGFVRTDGRSFPGLEMNVLSSGGDTIVSYDDLYAQYPDGFEMDPLLLNTNITLADPIHSNVEYHMKVRIWDKKGDGYYIAEMDFEVLPNEAIQIENGGLQAREIYLFSAVSNKTITVDEVKFNENVYLLFEGLEGFRQVDGQLLIGLKMVLTDGKGKEILNEPDLFGDRGLDPLDVYKQIASNFIVSDTSVPNPVSVEVRIWDKNSENRITASVSLDFSD
jgi:hypothetical protein